MASGPIAGVMPAKTVNEERWLRVAQLRELEEISVLVGAVVVMVPRFNSFAINKPTLSQLGVWVYRD